eukprot:351188-Chlamydomonas_euryale.AAC.4
MRPRWTPAGVATTAAAAGGSGRAGGAAVAAADGAVKDDEAEAGDVCTAVCVVGRAATDHANHDDGNCACHFNTEDDADADGVERHAIALSDTNAECVPVVAAAACGAASVVSMPPVHAVAVAEHPEHSCCEQGTLWATTCALTKARAAWSAAHCWSAVAPGHASRASAACGLAAAAWRHVHAASCI